MRLAIKLRINSQRHQRRGFCLLLRQYKVFLADNLHVSRTFRELSGDVFGFLKFQKLMEKRMNDQSAEDFGGKSGRKSVRKSARVAALRGTTMTMKMKISMKMKSIVIRMTMQVIQNLIYINITLNIYNNMNLCVKKYKKYCNFGSRIVPEANSRSFFIFFSLFYRHHKKVLLILPPRWCR